MKVKEILKDIRERNIDISINGDDLQIRSGHSEVPPALFEDIRINKADIITYLKKNRTGTESYKPIPEVPSGLHYPLSSSQMRLWVLSQFAEINVAYNMSEFYILDGPLSREALEYSFTALLDRHETLRTVFKEDENGEIRQFIRSPQEIGFKIGYRDLRQEKEKQKIIDSRVKYEFTVPFDLSTGPLLRVSLYQMEVNKWFFSYTMHHIICDGWSMTILFNELFLNYDSRTKGHASLLKPLRIQYKDYASWQQALSNGEKAKTDKAYWLRQFEGQLPLLELPVSKSRPPVKTYRGGRLSKKIGPVLTAGIKALCKQQGCTPFMGMLSVVTILLYRYTGQKDIVIGAPIAGREHADLEGQIGFFINTLALRIRFGGEDSPRKLLNIIRQVTLGAYEHQLYPFNELVNELKLNRDMSRDALFDVMVILQNTGGFELKEKSRGNVKISTYDGAKEVVSKFDLTFFFEDSGDEMLANLEYNRDIYDHDAILGMAGHLEQLLKAVVESPEMPVQDLQYLRDEERRRLLMEFNDTAKDYPDDSTIVGLLQEQTARTPDNIAVTFGDATLTYKELNGRANQLGGYLRQYYNIQPDDLIGIQLERSEWMIVAILAVLKSGGGYVPVDPSYPEERIGYIISDSKCKAIIDGDFLTKFIGEQKQYGKEDLSSINSPRDLAYVIYTSGSTGQPKGVMIEHRSACAFLHWCKDEFHVSAFDTVLGVTSACFDLSVFEIFYTLSVGKKLKLLTNALAVAEHLNTSENILLNTVPGVVGALLNSNANLSRIKVLNMAGEPIPPRYIDRLDCRAMEVRNLYGPSEATTYSSVYRIRQDSPVLIGRPIANTRIYILSECRHLQPPGVTGEIWISGAGLARGYLGRPELTAERFVSDPFKPAECMYRTGDLGRWLPDGNIEFAGRKDDQVKIRGYRIEPGEIESVLQRHEAIEAAAVVAGVNGNGEAELVAYLVGKEPLEAAKLRSYLIRILPAYMLPAHFVQLDNLPLTPNGKVDKKRLPGYEGAALPAGVEYAAPGNEAEEKLVSIWQSLLGREKIGIHDNFFEVGGNSITIIKLAKLAGRALNKEINVTTLFQYSNIKGLVDFITQEAAVLPEEAFDREELMHDLSKFNF